MAANNSKSVLLPQPIAQEAIDMLKREGLKVIEAEDIKLDRIKKLIKNADYLILRTGITMDSELLSEAENLKTISRTGAGIDNIDMNKATKKKILVTSSIGANTTSVAEHCLALILGFSKSLNKLDKAVRKNNFSIRYEYYPEDILDKNLGIIGFGRIGKKVAEYFNIFTEGNIYVYDPILSDSEKNKYNDQVTFLNKEDLLLKSDYISLHVPLNQHTKDLLTLKDLKLMKKSAVIVNTARGGVINEGDLITALQENLIKGAALDVFESEPPDPESPLLNLDNVLLTPHTSALTKECSVRMATRAAQRVIDVFNNKKPKHIANPEVLKLDEWKNLE
ncbi:MAG: NAD(P)-dependent oxidoreductase [Halanaerobium sp.]